MLSSTVSLIWAGSLIFLPCFACAQKATTLAGRDAVVAESPLPKRVLDLTQVEPLTGLPASTAMGYPEHCSSDGYIYLEIYAVSGQGVTADFPEIYSISQQREISRVALPLPTGYKQFVLGSLFAAKDRVVGLIRADQPTDPAQARERGKLTSFLSITGRNGDHGKLVKLDVNFEPAKAAIFDSGRLLILGTDPANLEPVLAMVHDDGSLDRILDLDTRPYQSSQELSKTYARRESDSNSSALQRRMLGAVNVAQFVPWGAKILLVQPGSALPVLVFRDSGQQGAVRIKPPDGFLVDSILGSDEKDTWVILTKEAKTFQSAASNGVIENPTQNVFEVDPLTGNVIDQLVVKGPHPGEISCAAGSRISAVYYGLPQQANVPDQLTYASAPR